MDVTARDAQVAWFSTDEWSALLGIVEDAYDDAIPHAAPYMTCLGAVDAFLVDLAAVHGWDTPYASGHISHAVWMSLNENLRSPVRQRLLTEMIVRGHVRYQRNQVQQQTGAQASVYPSLFRYYITARAPVTLAQRRNVYAALRKLYKKTLQSLVDAVDERLLVAGIRARFALRGWTLDGVRVGNLRVPGYAQLYEDGRDSFRVEQEGDGLTHAGERVVAEVDKPGHPRLRRHHHVYEDANRTQHNFLVDACVVLLVRNTRSGERRAVSMPLSVVDLTVQTKDVHLEATAPRAAKRTYDLLPGVRVHSLSPLGWYRRELALDNAARAGAFLAFHLAEGGSVEEGDVPKGARATLRTVLEAIAASQAMDASVRHAGVITPDTIQDTFY
tara:strand:+ start:1930 stop:3090 length:1161 start_codon:yes stop_codon:yes gene_type:complete